MDDGRGWLRTHWRTALALVLIFGISLFLRFYFVYGLAFPQGLYTGGSDSYYWERALRYSYDTGKDLAWDPLLNYPVGLPNPRPPLFPWFSLALGRTIAPLFGDAWEAVVWVLLASTGLFGALTVFPTYLLAKEAFGRRAGLVAAFLLGVSAAHLGRSQATDADHDAFTLFFVVCTFYFYLRALRSLRTRRWVENWFSLPSIRAGTRAFVKEERTAILYALLAGLSVTAIALSWQGWAYVPVILLVYFVAQLFLDRVRNQDTMGVTALFGIILATPLLLALPWYLGRGQVRVWFDVPAYLSLVAMVLGVAFTVTRDYPWTLVIPSTFLAGAAGLGVGVLVNPALANAFVSGAGYFVQTKVYETIAEAQAPGLSQLILSFGWFTFYFSLAGVAYMIWQIPRRHEPAYTLIVVWTFASIFMAMAAARFIFNASPAFAVAAGFAIDLVIVRADFAGMRRSYRSLREGSWRNALRKSVKLRHVVAVLAIAGLVLLPNVWFGVDASIPYERKAEYDRQVHDLLPGFLQSPRYEDTASGQGSFYFGAFGYSLPQEGEYFPAAWRWFATQDGEEDPAQRPAFLSWWDYGFEAVDKGQHPTVADNFQSGFGFAGQFITAQGEAQALALLSIRLLEGDIRNHRNAFSAAVQEVLGDAGLPLQETRAPFLRPQDYVSVIADNPQVYGAWDEEIQPFNAVYIYLAKVLTGRFDLEGLAQLYRALRGATGTEIGYFVVDARLFPISAQNTGIFYAPVKLSDHRVLTLADGRTLPTEFFQIFVTTDRGSDLPLQIVRPDEQIQSQRIEYQPMFYNSMFYRAYVGYSPTDLGSPQEKGIPGFTEALQAAPPTPAWNLSHFRVVYRTAYYNPFPDPANHTEDWTAMEYADALRLQEEIVAGRVTGVVDLSTQSSITNGLVFLRYYDGAWVNGTVLAGGTTPVPGVTVTATDELGTPHNVTTTDANGRYSLIVPFGNVTITASLGTRNPRTLQGSRALTSVSIPVSLGQAMREDVDADLDGKPDWILERDLLVPGIELRGTLYFDLDRDGAFGSRDRLAPGATVTVTSRDAPLTLSAGAGPDSTFQFPALLQGAYGVRIEVDGRTVVGADLDLSTSTVPDRDLPVPFAEVRGFANLVTGVAVGDATVSLRDPASGGAQTVTTAADGRFSFAPVLAGQYELSVDRGDVAALPVLVTVAGADRWQNFTLSPSGRVSGVTRIYGMPVPYATIELQSAAGVHLVRSVTSDASGAFTVTLPAGDWNVAGRLYSGGRLYAALGRLAVLPGDTTTYTATFVDGARIEGTVHDPTAPNATVARAQITFLGDGGDWWTRTGQGGAYLAYLPLGTYGVQAFSSRGVARDAVALSTDRSFDLTLIPATAVTGTVYRDADGDRFPDNGEGIHAPRLELTDDLGRKALGTGNESGDFVFFADVNRTYSGIVTARGFLPRSVASSTPAGLRGLFPMALEAVPVDVSGTLLLDDVPIRNRAVTVRALAVLGGAVEATGATDLNGVYRFDLPPGTYDLVVDENASTSEDRRLQNLGSDRLVVRIGGSPVVRDLAITERILVTGNTTLGGSPVAAAMSFDGAESRTVGSAGDEGFRVYLRPGTYSVRANATVDGRAYGVLEVAEISSPGFVSHALEAATTLTGVLQYGGRTLQERMPITFDRLDGGSVRVQSDEGGRYTTALVPGAYGVRLDFVVEQAEGVISRFYRYTFAGFVDVTAGGSTQILNLDLSRELHNATVAGAVTSAGAGTLASLAFYAREGGALDATARSTASGTFEVALAPGVYDVHVEADSGDAAYLRRVTIEHPTPLSLDIALVPGYALSGVTTDARGLRIPATVTIGSSPRLTFETDGSGAYGLVLPAGTYALTASREGTEQGVDVDYRASASVDLSGDRVVNLRLEKSIVRTVALTWDPSQKQTIPGSGSVTYEVDVENTGNVADTFVLTGRAGSGVWSFTFAPSSVALDFGDAGRRRTVSVTITAPGDALVEHGPIALFATSATDTTAQGRVNVDVGIVRTRSLELRVDATTGSFDGRFANYTVEIGNRGNAAENVTISITNPDDAASSGWIPRLAREGSSAAALELAGILVPANQTVKVRLRVESAGGASAAVIVLTATTRDHPAIQATIAYAMQLPALASPEGVAVGGPGIVKSPSLNMALVAVAAAAVTAAALAFFLTRRRR